MKNRVNIYAPKPSPTLSDGGHADESSRSNWILKGSRRCHIFTRGGAEKWRFNQVEAEVMRIVELQFDSLTRQIEPTWQIGFRNGATELYWDIGTAFDVDAGRKTMQVHCVEVVA